MFRDKPHIDRVRVSAYSIPTDTEESDGTLVWDQTTLVIVEVEGASKTGLGYSYCDAAAASIITRVLSPIVVGADIFLGEKLWTAMRTAVRNIGYPGIAACAISAVDIALWDLRAKLLDVSLVQLLGSARRQVPAYGSGGFTSYDLKRLTDQLAHWVSQGCRYVKMKVGRKPDQDVERVRAARNAVGTAELFIDANGAYKAKQALGFAASFAESGVTWFEEPVSSDDLSGLHFLRMRMPATIEVAAGEYGYHPQYFRYMLEADAVDVLQADATRCGGITGFLRAAALCDAYAMPLSCHCAPAAHLHAACAAPRLRHLEWFHDHVRIEQMLFDGAPRLDDGIIAPDWSRPGLGLEFKRTEAERYAI